MDINRRKLLKCLSGCGALTVIGGVPWGRMTLARHQLASQLVEEASGIREAFARDELKTLPTLARQKIETWFQAPCLNSAEFVEYICSETFAEKLANCSTQRDREYALSSAFVKKVVSAGEITDAVKEITDEVDQQLNSNWERCCQQIEEAWKSKLDEFSAPLPTAALTAEVTPIINRHLKTALGQSEAAAHRPTVTNVTVETVQLIGATIWIARIDPRLAIPIVVSVALLGVCRYVLGRLGSRPSNYQKAISDHVTQLAKEIGREMEAEVAQRIKSLHEKQQLAFEKVADEYAQESIGLFS